MEIKYTKTSNSILNQNVNVTEQTGFSTFAISIVDKLCLLQQYKINNTQAKYDCCD